jgi:hypothetical protein
MEEVSYVPEPAGQEHIDGTFPAAFANDVDVEIPEVLCLYTVVDGKFLPRVFLREELEKRDRLSVDGYVSGVVVLCEREMSVSINGRMLSKIQKGEDGRLNLESAGRPGAVRFPFSGRDRDEPYFAEPLEAGRRKWSGGAGYFLLANPTGNLITADANLSITLESKGRKLVVEVRQNGSRDLHISPPFFDRSVTFKYVGTRLQELRGAHADFESRLQAVAEGVRLVESRFNTELVSQVTIIDCEGIHNAITSREGTEVWFYVDVLLKEPVIELGTIAAHETLHKLVGKLRLSETPELRKLFAELKGYDLFSKERFMLVLTGAVPSDCSEPTGFQDLFFAFIDEKNFIDGMKGGHSGENLEEFCTSMTHSLLFIDKLEQNLNKPLLFPGSPNRPKSLTHDEKASIVEKYARVIGCLIMGLESSDESDVISLEEAGGVFERGLRIAMEIQERL